ncbi:hypothetical protein GO755_34525 [Spirosoma sp. HMF4905]|uniref:MFS transporter n=1 Tax=Spirosoma arboris TaxID=2682092 RepID=A0A7K1SN31_9BACT|nr:DUF5690 family protein [Spirosoma arboris]MVM35191.1 hypothetical protein [Spirosoma arboris]
MAKQINFRLQKIVTNPIWVLVAAFGTYFCMYGFRKPYTAASFKDVLVLGVSYKFLLIIAQTVGYVAAKWIGIKFVSEIKPEQRIRAIVLLMGFAELMLLFFGITPRPWSMVCMLLNGLPLGVIFGLVLSFVEGRKNTEFLIAGLCASFIVSDGVSKSIGAMLLSWGISENWMPFLAGLIFMVPILVCIGMLSVVPLPSAADIEKRSARLPMTGADRTYFFRKYMPGLLGIILIYLFATLLRSIRADFAVELWSGLGYTQTPALFTTSELIVSFGVIVILGLAFLIRNHSKAFNFALFTNLVGFSLLLVTVLGLDNGLGKFQFMVLAGLGIYLPYVAVHAVVFERLIAMTRERATVGFLMYIVDSVGYTGYIGLLILRYFTPIGESILSIFLKLAVGFGMLSVLIVLFCYVYFRLKLHTNEQRTINFPAGQSSSIQGAG